MGVKYQKLVVWPCSPEMRWQQEEIELGHNKDIRIKSKHGPYISNTHNSAVVQILQLPSEFAEIGKK